MGENFCNIFKRIVEASYDGIYVTDGKGNTIFINKAYEELTGLSIKDLQGKNMETLVEEGLFDESGSLSAIRSRKKITISQKLKSGKSIFVTSSPVFNEKGEIVYVVTNVRDMRELERMEQQFKRTKELAEKYKKELDFIKQKEKKEAITNNKDMLNILNMLEMTAKFNTSILLEGETGTGKSYMAKKIHENSLRKDERFIEVNCGAIPKNLIESELFGYEAGTFTGADKNGKKGLFELANNSTLFLDEISELPLDMQVKLLKVLETGYVIRLGGNKPIPIDVRIITASNKNLKSLVEKNEFRKDLYYRINVVKVCLPPIRERKEDIVLIAMNFLKQFNKTYGLDKRISENVFKYFMEYNWPGNIREIKNIVEQLVVVSQEEEIKANILPNELLNRQEITYDSKTTIICKKCDERYYKMNLKDATTEFQREVIEKLMRELKSQRKVAEHLDVNPSTITRKLQEK
ncbi:MAG: sigma 54-interacting transcriptional regulator [Fusobacterium sp.]|nr:sigma 54-interacting transcriptional regulator [Fusobacterium sp.]